MEVEDSSLFSSQGQGLTSMAKSEMMDAVVLRPRLELGLVKVSARQAKAEELAWVDPMGQQGLRPWGK